MLLFDGDPLSARPSSSSSGRPEAGGQPGESAGGLPRAKEKFAVPARPWERRWARGFGTSRWLAVVTSLFATIGFARAQLAITEAMAWESTNCFGCGVLPRGCHPDFFELTNFGTNAVDLSGYLLVDRDATFPDSAWPIPDGVTIQPRESMIFVRTWEEVSTPAEFRAWWGELNLPADLQIVFYPKQYGFDQLGDAARLWDAHSNVVDQFYFGESRRGVSFGYDLGTGAAEPSVVGVNGAFQSAECGDVGSPGWAPGGPVPLRVARQPVSQWVDAGSDVVFRAEATGLPRPFHFEWYRNGIRAGSAPVASDFIPRVVNYAGCSVAWKSEPRFTDLAMTNVQPGQAGDYYVVFFNGLERATSVVVSLTVNTNPSPPRVECPSSDRWFPRVAGRPQTNLTVSPLQTAMFEVLVRGYPTPTCRWSWSANGVTYVDLPGATNRSLTVSPAVAGHSGIYRVRLQNAYGTNYAYASLSVKDKAQLRVTEVMLDSCYVNEDWWELTNLGDQPVDLFGYRWDDRPGEIGGGPTVTNSVVVQPGESVIFLEGLTPEFFRSWWGEDRLPPGLQIIGHAANGLEPDGDEINLWNPTATDAEDWIDSVVFSDSYGASWWFDPGSVCAEFGVVSVTGECGGFQAARSCDIGSPGWTAWTPPRLTSIRREGETVRLEWKALPGSATRVQFADGIGRGTSDTDWHDLGLYTFPGPNGAASDTLPGNGSPQRFYRLRRETPADCHCF